MTVMAHNFHGSLVHTSRFMAKKEADSRISNPVKLPIAHLYSGAHFWVERKQVLTTQEAAEGAAAVQAAAGGGMGVCDLLGRGSGCALRRLPCARLPVGRARNGLAVAAEPLQAVVRGPASQGRGPSLSSSNEGSIFRSSHGQPHANPAASGC